MCIVVTRYRPMCIFSGVARGGVWGFNPPPLHRSRFFTAVKLLLLNIITRLEGQLIRMICTKPTIWGRGAFASMVECVLTWIREQHLVVCNIAKWTILCIVVHFQPVIKITSKGCQSASQTCDFDAKNAKFFWGGRGPTPTPRRLDLNPSHSEILPTLLCIFMPPWVTDWPEAWCGRRPPVRLL